MANDHTVPRIGVGVFILNSRNEFVFGIRRGSHGKGTWALPGGHLELHETFEECARREVLEETGLDIEGIKFLTATNSPRIDGSKHYVTIFVVSKPVNAHAQPQLLEPNKCEGWRWISWETMLQWYGNETSGGPEVVETASTRDKLFLPMVDLVQQRPDVRPMLGL